MAARMVGHGASARLMPVFMAQLTQLERLELWHDCHDRIVNEGHERREAVVRADRLTCADVVPYRRRQKS